MMAGHPHLQHSRHARVTGIIQSGGTTDDVMRLLCLDRDNATAAIARAKEWHRRNPGDHRHHAVGIALPADVIKGEPACAGVDPELFFIGDYRGAHNTYDAARTVCAACEVRAACAEYAIADASLHGLWGGLDPQERADIRRMKREGKA
jgi:WhiB family transcriptional regulator, redox-sensing transcriptional regulator